MSVRRLVLGSLLLALAVSVATYPWLPAQMPVHFDLAGRADGFAPRAFGALLLPAALGLLFALTWVRQSGAMGFVLALTSMFFAGLHVLVVRAALGDGALGGGMWLLAGAFFVALGLVLPRVRRNRWVGVRTPWAMRSPEAWARTQRVGGYAMCACGLLLVISAGDAGAPGMALRAIAIFGAGLVPIVYSWWAARDARSS